MDFTYSDKTKALIDRIQSFMDEHIYPNEQVFLDQVEAMGHDWQPAPIIQELKPLARKAGLWNLFLPVEYGDYSGGLTNLEYAPLCELMGRVMFAPEVFNCSAPDTGNMEVLAKYEAGLYPFIEERYPQVFAELKEKEAIDDSLDKAMADALKAYGEEFKDTIK